MEMYEKVEKIIMDEYESIKDIDSLTAALGVDGITYIKEYVNGITDNVLAKGYTDSDYIKEYLEDMIGCELLNDNLREAYVYMILLYNIFKD